MTLLSTVMQMVPSFTVAKKEKVGKRLLNSLHLLCINQWFRCNDSLS